MTIKEFHNNFDIEVDKTMDFEFPYILPEQKDYWLNKAQEKYIDQIAYPLNKQLIGFEQDQKRIDDLSWIVKLVPLTVVQTSNGYKCSLPVDYFHLVRHQCTTIDPTGCNELKTVGGLQTTHEFINQMLKDPFWEPSVDEPLYYLQGKDIIYETKGKYVLSSTDITYIKIPNAMRLGSEYINPTTDIQCELNPMVHNDILNIAVSMVLENFESQRYQTNLNELNNN